MIEKRFKDLFKEIGLRERIGGQKVEKYIGYGMHIVHDEDIHTQFTNLQDRENH